MLKCSSIIGSIFIKKKKKSRVDYMISQRV
jgi:hypothetical protein